MLPMLRCWTCLWLAVVLPRIQTMCFDVNSTSSTERGRPTLLAESHHSNGSVGVSADTGGDATGIGFLDEAFEEQGYYLQRLFLQYGENGTLSYGGLQRLLGSLGLGELSVLEISQRGVKPGPPSAWQAHTLHRPPASSSGASHWDNSLTDRPDFLSGSWEGLSGGPWGPVWETLVENIDLPEFQAGVFENGSWSVSKHTTLCSRACQMGLCGRRMPELHLRSCMVEHIWTVEMKGWIILDHPLSPIPALDSHSLKPHTLPWITPLKTISTGNCLNVTQLLWNFGLGRASHITPAHFTFLCPALLYQIDSRVCLRHTEEHAAEEPGAVLFLIALGWGSLALTLISLPSLLALGVVPLLTPALLQSLLCPMVALAVGTLCGDALLHLLPHANSGFHSASGMQNSVMKGLSVLAGLYLLFLVESIMELHRHQKKENKEPCGSAQNVMQARELVALQGASSLEEYQPTQSTNEADSEHRHGHPPPRHSGMASLVWMVVAGDGIHNFTDGLAIGAAFSRSLSGGLSTTVAVFCHELPHELGDLAVLLAAGWPLRRLLLFSGMSAALGLLGLGTGTVLGHHLAQISPWILAATAGVFLHVALADMMPEMLHGECGPMAPLTRFLLQHVGLVAGVGIMLCIALFEEDIALSLGDG